MHKSSFVSLLLALTIATAGSSTAGAQEGGDKDSPPLVPGKWLRIFTDEFDGQALDTNLWTNCYWWNDNGCTNLGNNELEWYMPANIKVSDGHLRLIARPENVTGYKGRTFKYTSGMVTTGRDYRELPRPPRFSFQYGLVEIRARLPGGKGIWPALWLLPSTRKSRPEIDIMEVLGDAPKQLEMHFHYTDATGKGRSTGQAAQTTDLTKDWHVYGLRWEPDAIVWYLDGVEKWRYSAAANIPREDMYLLMNLAVGGNWPGAPDEKTRFPAEFLIDYVRVWQREPS